MTSTLTFEDRLLDELRQVVAANPAPAAPARRAGSRRPLALAGAGLVAASAAAAVVTLAGGGTSSAWAIDSQPDGSVTVHISSLRDAGGLQDGLRNAGIPAVVTYSSDCAPTSAPAPGDPEAGTSSGHFETGPSLKQAAPTPSTKGGIAREKVTSSVRTTGDGVTFSLDPGRINPGEKVYITTSTGQADAIGIAIGRQAPPAGCDAAR